MVNGVSGYSNGATNLYRVAGATYIQSKNDVENLIKFNSGLPIELTADPTIAQTVSGTIPLIAIFGGVQGLSTVKSNGWSLKNTINAINSAKKQLHKMQTECHLCINC